MISALLDMHPSLAELLLRVVLGVVFMSHGYPKLFKAPGPAGFAAQLKNINVPAPLLFAYVVGSVEFFGGFLVIVGLLTRAASVLIAINMIVAMWKIKFKTGLVTKVMEGGWAGGYELDLALCSIAVSLALTGPGVFSIDHLV